MHIQQATQLIKKTVSEAVELCKEKGFSATARVYYSDKALRECKDFNDSVILVFGAIKLGLEDMDEDDYCTYGMCCETKLAEVKDEEIAAEVAKFKEDVEKLLEEISASDSPKAKIVEINERQEKEAAVSMKEFDAEMRKMKIKLYSALGVIAVIAAAMVIVGFIL